MSARSPVSENHKLIIKQIRDQHREFLSELKKLHEEQKKLLADYRQHLEMVKIKMIKNKIQKLTT